MTEEERYRVYCPVCDRKYESLRSKELAMNNMIKHVERAHPEYDVEQLREDDGV